MTKTKLIFIGLAVALVGFLFAGSASAQDQTLTLTPSVVPEAGTHEILVEGEGFTLSSVNLLFCGTADEALILEPEGGAGLIAECGGFGDSVDLEADGTYSATHSVEVGEDGAYVLLFQLAPDGEGAGAAITIGEAELPATGVNTSLLVIIGAGIALAGVMVFGLSRRLRTL